MGEGRAASLALIVAMAEERVFSATGKKGDDDNDDDDGEEKEEEENKMMPRVQPRPRQQRSDETGRACTCMGCGGGVCFFLKILIADGVGKRKHEFPQREEIEQSSRGKLGRAARYEYQVGQSQTPTHHRHRHHHVLAKRKKKKKEKKKKLSRSPGVNPTHHNAPSDVAQD